LRRKKAVHGRYAFAIIPLAKSVPAPWLGSKETKRASRAGRDRNASRLGERRRGIRRKNQNEKEKAGSVREDRGGAGECNDLCEGHEPSTIA